VRFTVLGPPNPEIAQEHLPNTWTPTSHCLESGCPVDSFIFYRYGLPPPHLDMPGLGQGFKGYNCMKLAWLSTMDEPGLGGSPGVDAIDRIPDGRYELLDGTVIADDKADLTDGRLKAPINVNERGEPLNGFAWTGTSPDGTNTGTNCSDWTNATSPGTGQCTAGDDDCGDRGSSAINSDWTQQISPTACNQDFHLYCFGSGQ
jgi:hypothetical protein